MSTDPTPIEVVRQYAAEAAGAFITRMTDAELIAPAHRDRGVGMAESFVLKIMNDTAIHLSHGTITTTTTETKR